MTVASSRETSSAEPVYGPVPAALERARAVGDAVLYEGYLLYPYRRSSGKNRVRFQFGVLSPPAWIEARGPVDTSVAGSAESWWQQTECLLEPRDDASITVRLRFLQLQHKQIERIRDDGSREPVDALETGGQRHLTFEEAVPHEIDARFSVAELAAQPRVFPVHVPGGVDVEPVVDPEGRQVAAAVRNRAPLSARLTVSAETCSAPFRLLRLRIRTDNSVDELEVDAPRSHALRRSLLATHTLVAAERARFVSLLDPPHWAENAVATCRNVHTFPVLVGDEGATDAVLSSPLLMYDHPQIAPESQGDLHDCVEIDEILSLRTMTLSDEEKREVRATDPRAAAILDRVDTMPPEVLERLHGAIRSMGPVATGDTSRDQPDTDDGEPAWWEPGGDDHVSRTTDTVLVSGVRLGAGSRVRLRPRRRGTDVHDLFLDGRAARVREVLLDVDGTRFLAVTVDDDPGADLHHWYGRLRHFRTEEVEPLEVDGEQRR